MVRRFRSSALLVALGTVACSGDQDWNPHVTIGEQGRIGFVYTRPTKEYSLDHGLLPGGSEVVRMTGAGDGEDWAVASSEPSVALFTVAQEHCPEEAPSCGSSILVDALAEGSARLEVSNSQGHLSDSVWVHVRVAETGSIEASEARSDAMTMPVDAVSLRLDEGATLGGTFRDAEGRLLLGAGAARWSIDDPVVLELSPSDPFFTTSIRAAAPGSTTVRLRAPGVELRLPVAVVP